MAAPAESVGRGRGEGAPRPQSTRSGDRTGRAAGWPAAGAGGAGVGVQGCAPGTDVRLRERITGVPQNQNKALHRPPACVAVGEGLREGGREGVEREFFPFEGDDREGGR